MISGLSVAYRVDHTRIFTIANAGRGCEILGTDRLHFAALGQKLRCTQHYRTSMTIQPNTDDSQIVTRRSTHENSQVPNGTGTR